MCYVDDAHAPLRVRKEHYLKATHPLRRRRYAFKAGPVPRRETQQRLEDGGELEAEGLVTYGGRKSLSLTEAGRRRVEELN